MSTMPSLRSPFDRTDAAQSSMPGVQAPNLQPFDYQIAMPAPEPKRRGMFAGASIDLSGALAGFAAGMGNPAGMAALQDLQRRRQMGQQQEAEAAQYQQGREDKYQDWVRQQQWQLEHPEARAPHYFESNSGDQYTIGPDGKPQLLFKDPLRYKFIPNGQGGVVPVDVEKLMGGASAGPEILSELPPGAKPMGGAGQSQAPRPFPFR